MGKEKRKNGRPWQGHAVFYCCRQKRRESREGTDAFAFSVTLPIFHFPILRERRGILVCIRKHIPHPSVGFAVSVDAAAAKGMEDAMPQAFVLHFQLPQKFFHVFTFGFVIFGAKGVENRHLRCVAYIVADILFLGIEQGADQVQIGAGKIGNGGKAAEPPLIEKIQHEGVHYIVKVMAEGDALTTHLNGGAVESAAPEIGTESAGIFFFADVKDDGGDIRTDEVEGNAECIAVGGDRIKIAAWESHIDSDGAKRKGDGIEAAERGERGKECHGILTAGNAHSDGITGSDHVIVVQRAACKTEDSL